MLRGLGEGRGGPAGDLSGPSGAAAAVEHERCECGGDALRGGLGDGAGVDGRSLVGGGLGGDGAVDAGLQCGELVGVAGAFQVGVAPVAVFADGEFGADAVEVVGEAHRVGEGVGVDAVDRRDALELGDGPRLKLGEVGVGCEGEVGRGGEELVCGHVFLRDRRGFAGSFFAL